MLVRVSHRFEKSNMLIIAGVFAFSMVFSLIINAGVLAAPTALNFQYEERDEDGELSIGESAVGPSNMLYQVGDYEGIIDFDPTSGTDTSADSSDESGIIRSFQANGAYDDTRVLTSDSGDVSINNIVFTADKSEYYITGNFEGEVDFDFGAGEEVLTSTSDYWGNGFVARYNTADDTLDQVSALTGTGEEHDAYIAGIALNPNGSSFAVYGSFEGGVDLDMTEGEDDFSSDADEAGFISTYDDDFNYITSNIYDYNNSDLNIGVYNAAYTSGGYLYYAVDIYNNGDDLDIELDMNPEVEGTVDVEFRLGSESGSSAIVKVDDNGATYEGVWELQSFSGDYEYGVWFGVSEIVVGDGDDVYYSGSFEGSVDLNPEGEGNDDHSSLNGTGFVTKMESDGTYGYSYVQGGTEVGTWFSDLVTSTGGIVYVTGEVWSVDGSVTVDIDPSGTITNRYIEDSHSVLIGLNGSGAQTSAYVSGSENSIREEVGDYGRTVALDSLGNVYTTSSIYYKYGAQDPDSCEVSEDWLYGVGTAKFAATGASVGGWFDFEAIPSTYIEGCDADGDGISDSDEANNPYTDANDDGEDDSEQASVAAFTNPVTEQLAAISVVGDDDCSLENVSIQSKAEAASGDSYDYPLGLFDFEAICTGDTGFTATISQYFYNPPEGEFIARKVVNGAYSTIAGATINTETINGEPVLVITYEVTDGGELDADGTANGTVVDPAGPAVLASQTTSGGGASGSGGALANTGESLYATISLGMAVITFVTLLAVLSRRIETTAVSND